MNTLRITAKSICVPLVVALTLGSTSAVQAKGGGGHEESFYQQRTLVSDGIVPGAVNDPNLLNGWGVAFNPSGPVWVTDNGSGVSTLYDGDGNPQSLVVTIPPASGKSVGTPTGIVFNTSPGFKIPKRTSCLPLDESCHVPGAFIFATEDGLIAAWARIIDDPTLAITVINNSGQNGAVYKGLAIGVGDSRLYAADFHNNKIDVFDNTFAPVALPADAFVDPNLPEGYGPFGLQAINGEIFVSYAKQDADKQDDIKGKGLGFINVFDPNGRLVRRLVSAGKLNAPWGMALAPAGFGKFSGRLLVGNFGDGRINGFDLATGAFVGELKGANHKPVKIDGLWGIAFGNGFRNQPVNTLFFAAGPGEEAHGSYGRIDFVNSPEHHHRRRGGHSNDD